MITTPKAPPAKYLNSEREEFSYGIDQSNIGVVMHILRNQLYSNKILAVLREYSTNAADIHKEYKVKKPVEIKLPTLSNPILSIRDFGPGLNKDDISKTYILLGASTKRKSNLLMGCLGLGSKAGFAYSDSFTVISRHQGKETTYQAYLDQSQEGRLLVVGTKPTTETGIEVIIPVQEEDKEEFYRTASTFFASFRSPITITPPVKLDQTLRRVVVMGDVAYPYHSKELGFTHYIDFTLTVPIGAVDITASREALEYTEKTKVALRAACSKELTKRQKALQKKINRKQSWYSAQKHYLDLPYNDHKQFSSLDFEYHGEPIYQELSQILNSKVCITATRDINTITLEETATFKHSVNEETLFDSLFGSKFVCFLKTPAAANKYSHYFNDEIREIEDLCVEIMREKRLRELPIIPFTKDLSEISPCIEKIPSDKYTIIIATNAKADDNTSTDTDNLAAKTQPVKKPKKRPVKKNPSEFCVLFSKNWRKSVPADLNELSSTPQVYITLESLSKYRAQTTLLERLQTLAKLSGVKPPVYLIKGEIPEHWEHLDEYIRRQCEKEKLDLDACAAPADHNLQELKLTAEKATPQFKQFVKNSEKAIQRKQNILQAKNITSSEFNQLVEPVRTFNPILHQYPLLASLSWWHLRNNILAVQHYIHLCDIQGNGNLP